MSYRHVEVLREVRGEFDAVRACAKSVRNHWSTLAGDLDPVKLADIESAEARLEATYIVRLTAAYEAIAYDYLVADRARKIGQKASGAELTNQLSGLLQDKIKNGQSRLKPDERQKITQIKRYAEQALKLLSYRNKIAHRKPPEKDEFSFKESLTTLNRLLDLIP